MNVLRLSNIAFTLLLILALSGCEDINNLFLKLNQTVINFVNGEKIIMVAIKDTHVTKFPGASAPDTLFILRKGETALVNISKKRYSVRDMNNSQGENFVLISSETGRQGWADLRRFRVQEKNKRL